VEAGSNISTVTLRVVRGDEKGSLKSEIVIYGQESKGTRTRGLRWRGPAAIVNDRPVLSSEGCYIRTMTAGVQLKKKRILAVSLNGLGPKTY
jgi:hypothetical protein